jgi:outer membrane protein TolC
MKSTAILLIFMGLLFLSGSAWAQAPGASSAALGDAGLLLLNVPSASGMAQAGVSQSPLLRGIPSGSPSPSVLALSLQDAVDRGLRHNLGIALAEQNVHAVQSSRLRALSALLPHVSAQTSETVEQVNLASVGFSGFPGVRTMVGPFSVFDIRAFASQSLLNLSALSQLRAGNESMKAAEHSNKNTRDLVVLACLQLYMQAVAGSSRVEANQAQFKTAQVLYNLAVSRHNAGFVPGIEELRARVQMQAQQQRLLVAQNEFAKQKLNLAQAIGLPFGQEYQLTDSLPFAPLSALSVESALQDAFINRGDYLSGIAQVKAAEEARQAAGRLKLPSAELNANYGDIGPRPWQSHGTFLVQVNLRVPIFQGKDIEARVLAADAQLAQQKAELESLRARIYYEVRTALLDLQSSEERVAVTKSNLDLASQQVAQAQDRFSSGVASNIEVVQAQDALALVTEDYIASLFAHNLAKANLAMTMGLGGTGYQRFLQSK